MHDTGKLSVVDQFKQFSEKLIVTRDLDPVYVALHGAALDEPQLCRWLLAYMFFYHVGAASWLSEWEGANFWGACLIAARNEEPTHLGGRWPRSAERRHFRGQKCVDAVTKMSLEYEEPEMHIRQLRVSCWTEKHVIEALSHGWPMFGPWAGFKLADLLERCAGYKIQFSPNIGLMYSEPAAALDILAAEDPSTDSKGHYNALLEWVAGYGAPPSLDRPCGPQELETCLCKFKSSRGGHYHIGKDIVEVRHALDGWGRTGGRLLAAAPGEV